MKKLSVFCVVVFSALAMISCASSQGEKEKKIRLDFDAPIRASFSTVDLDEDLATLKYLVTTAYAGYPQAQENGFDADASIAEIREAALKNLTSLGMIDSEFYQNKIFEVLNRDMKLNDMHFTVQGFGNSSKSIAKYLRFTNLYFEEKGDEYYSLYSDDERIPMGAKFTGPEKNLYETFYEDRILYRYAVYAAPNTTRLTVSLDGEQYPVSVIKPEEFTYTGKLTGFIESDECIYVSLTSFNIAETGNDYYQFCEITKKISNADPEKTVILDLRGNGGGVLYFAPQLVASMYFPVGTEEHMNFYNFLLNESNKHQVQIKSEADEQKREYYKKQFDAVNKVKEESEYSRDSDIVLENNDIVETYSKDSETDRTVIILMNGGTASTSEYTIGLSYLAKDSNVILVGNRTCGAVDYVSNWSYTLPKSGLKLFFGSLFGASPCVLQNENFKGEGEGFWPDWWTTNENILNTLIQLTEDQSLSEKLAGLNKKQL